MITHHHITHITRFVAHTVFCLAAAPDQARHARPAAGSPELGQLRGGDLGGGVGDLAGRSTERRLRPPRMNFRRIFCAILLLWTAALLWAAAQAQKSARSTGRNVPERVAWYNRAVIIPDNAVACACQCASFTGIL